MYLFTALWGKVWCAVDKRLPRQKKKNIEGFCFLLAPLVFRKCHSASVLHTILGRVFIPDTLISLG